MMTASYTESSQSDLVPTRNMKSTVRLGYCRVHCVACHPSVPPLGHVPYEMDV